MRQITAQLTRGEPLLTSRRRPPESPNTGHTLPAPMGRGRKGGTPLNRSRTAALVTWAYAAMFGIPAVPVASFLAENGRLPSLWGLFEMYGGPWSSQFSDDRMVTLLLVYLALVLAAVASGWLLWRMRKAGAVLNPLPAHSRPQSGESPPVPIREPGSARVGRQAWRT